MKDKVKHDQEAIKQHNKLLVLEIIKQRRPISRAEITKIAKMSPTSVGRIVSDLCEQGLVMETSLTSTGVGRKAVMLDIDPQAVFTIGVDIGKNTIRFGLVEYSGKLLHERHVPHSAWKTTTDRTVALIAETTASIVEAQAIDRTKLIGIGIGVPGVIDHEQGIVQLSSTLGWRGVSLSRELEKRCGIPVMIDNDLKVKLLAEYLYGSARDSRKTALIEFGTGVGSALMIDGDIFRGGSNSAGELGHTTLDPNGAMCECGKRGCLQTYIDESAILHEAGRMKEIADIGQLFDAARSDEHWAKDIVARASLYIGIAINNVVCLFNPDSVILSGNMIENFPEIVPLIREKCDQVVWEPFRGSFTIVTSGLKGQSIMIGAATLMMNHYVNCKG